jgi:hypothetical protein
MGHLLLDVDGVLIRDKLLTKHIEYNINQYVKTKLPSAKNPGLIRSVLYRRYGHTGHGLKKSFGIDTSDFDQKIYDKNLMDHLWEYMESKQFKDDAEDIHRLIQQDGWDVTLFSNAPERWTRPVALAIDSRVDITPDDECLKPDARAYSQFDLYKKYIFVDDSIQNLMTPSFYPNWTCIHFSDKPVQKRFMTARSIWETTLMVNSLRDWSCK